MVYGSATVPRTLHCRYEVAPTHSFLSVGCSSVCTMKRPIIVLDAADLDAVSSCWATLLGGEVRRREDDWHTVYVDGQSYLAVQLAPDHQPPQWPDGNPQQIHFDFYPDDVDALREAARTGGARLIQPQQGDDNFEVWADPAGHPFCICWEQ